MIHLDQGQRLFEEPEMVVYEPTGEYEDNALVICAKATSPNEPYSKNEARYIAYGNMVYSITNAKELETAIAAIDPANNLGETNIPVDPNAPVVDPNASAPRQPVPETPGDITPPAQTNTPPAENPAPVVETPPAETPTPAVETPSAETPAPVVETPPSAPEAPNTIPPTEPEAPNTIPPTEPIIEIPPVTPVVETPAVPVETPTVTPPVVEVPVVPPAVETPPATN